MKQYFSVYVVCTGTLYSFLFFRHFLPNLEKSQKSGAQKKTKKITLVVSDPLKLISKFSDGFGWVCLLRAKNNERFYPVNQEKPRENLRSEKKFSDGFRWFEFGGIQRLHNYGKIFFFFQKPTYFAIKIFTRILFCQLQAFLFIFFFGERSEAEGRVKVSGIEL